MYVSSSIDKETYDKMLKVVDALGISTSQFIKMLLQEALGIKHYKDFIDLLPINEDYHRVITKCIDDPFCKAIDLTRKQVYVSNADLWKDIEKYHIGTENMVIPLSSRIIILIV